MKQLLLLFAMVFSVGLMAQVAPVGQMTPAKTSKSKSKLGKFFVTATAGTRAFSKDELRKLTFKKL
jgi:hypothetical protein